MAMRAMPTCSTDRLYRATGEGIFQAACRSCLEQTLAQELPQEAGGGYALWQPAAQGATGTWQREPGLLYGSAGIALSLLSCLTDQDPTWDEMLMTKLPSWKQP